MEKGGQVGLRAKLLLLAFGTLVAFAIVEIWVRINPPFELRVKGEKISLWVNTERITNNNGHSPKLDSRIVFRKNSLGFRGLDPPKDFDESLTLVAVGGSTTESTFQSEGTTWPDRLGQLFEKSFARFWVNNAGLDGHSTFGHLALLRDHLVQLGPDVIVFLIGNNDGGLGAPSHKHLGLQRGGLDWTSPSAFVKSTAEYSDAAAMALQIYRYKRAMDLGLVYRGQIDLVDLGRLSTPPAERNRLRALHRETHLPPYRSRLLELIEVSRSHGIEPVFVTQPGLYGPAVDDVTGIDLATIERNGIDGGLAWEILELYNEETRVVGTEEGLLVVDLARSLPKSSRLFYDLVHYTNEGAVEIASILHADLCPFLAERFPAHLVQDCSTARRTAGDL